MSKQQIRISRLPTDRVRFVKALRLIGPMGLKQASDLAGHLERFRHSVVVAGVKPAVAAHVSQVLQDAGAEVLVEECAIETPMICFPTVDAKYKWGDFRRIEKSS
jgi:ribosomal protein L7/L12